MVGNGEVIISGPFGENENTYSGIFILNVKTIEEAKRLLKSDPAINVNLLEVELYP
ncbi:MAG TPA: hypothetical protein VKA26_13135 [Ignavibacteriaceae bacterium]|nr:hypothetical protein [Ignavibacteriaceae bacterium]